MIRPEDQPQKIIKIKRISPRFETQDSNTVLSVLEESTLEVCKAFVE